jgi:hypothetical protein
VYTAWRQSIVVLNSILVLVMGSCLSSSKKFVVNSNIEGQDAAALAVLQELGLSERDINIMYTAFWDMDADGSGKTFFIWFLQFCYFNLLLSVAR